MRQRTENRSDPLPAALALLARREHGADELRAKLKRQGAASADIEDTLSALQARGLQSDARFAESFVQAHYRRGDGPLKIEAALRARGLGEREIRPWLDDPSLDWSAAAGNARRKRFGAALPRAAAERAKQMRFLQQRGFTPDHIRAAFSA